MSCEFLDSTRDSYEQKTKVELSPAPLRVEARMSVPKFVCEVACASGFALPMNDDLPWNMRSIG
jgi:hypothetical protein